MRVVVFRTGHLGDTICAIPAFMSVRQHFAGAELTLVCDAPKSGKVPAHDVIASLGCFDRVATYESHGGLRSWLQLWRTIRTIRPDVLVFLTQQRESRIQIGRKVRFFHWAGARKVHVCGGSKISEGGWVPNEVQRLRSGLLGVGIPSSESLCSIPMNFIARNSVQEKLSRVSVKTDQPFIAFCGGGKAATQRWPLDRYAKVMCAIEGKTHIPIIAVGTPDEVSAYREQILPHFQQLRFVQGGLNLAEMFEIFRMASFYLGNDTGPMHVAAGVGCPVFAVLSARNRPGAWDPEIQPSHIVRNRTECENCFLERCVKERHRCLLDISAERVSEEVLAFIEKLQLEMPI